MYFKECFELCFNIFVLLQFLISKIWHFSERNAIRAKIKMIASNDDYLKEASNALYLLNEDFNIRECCRNRVEYY